MIEWLVQRAHDNPRVAAGLPPEGLLSKQETAVYDRLQSDKRRKDWILGRWTAKRLLQAAAEKEGGRPLPDSAISILAADDGAPELWLNRDDRLHKGSYQISISHAQDVSLCAVVAGKSYHLGADIEKIAPRSPRFIEDYFTRAEGAAVRQAPADFRDCLVTAIWSGKESALKALRQGLRLDTRSLSCHFPFPFQLVDQWQPFSIHGSGEKEDADRHQFGGWWRIWDDFVLTLVVLANEENLTQS